MNKTKQYLEIKQTYLVGDRADKGYYWSETRPTDLSLKDREAEPPYLMQMPETTRFISSEVMESEPTLFAKFAALDNAKNKAEAITRFANTYGNLFGLGLGESLSFWLEEIRYMALIDDLWGRLTRKDEKALKEIIHWSADKSAVSYVLGDTKGRLDANIYDPINIFERFPPGDVISAALYLVTIKIDAKLKEYTSKLTIIMTEENQPASYLVPENLLAAIWLQFSQVAAGEKDIRKCAVCGLWEVMTEKNRVWTRHQECANRQRVYKSRVISKAEKVFGINHTDAKKWVEKQLAGGSSFKQINKELSDKGKIP